MVKTIFPLDFSSKFGEDSKQLRQTSQSAENGGASKYVIVLISELIKVNQWINGDKMHTKCVQFRRLVRGHVVKSYGRRATPLHFATGEQFALKCMLEATHDKFYPRGLLLKGQGTEIGGGGHGFDTPSAHSIYILHHLNTPIPQVM